MSEALVTCHDCGETFTGPASHAQHRVGRRCVKPDAMPALTQRPDGVWKLTTIPGQLQLTFAGRRR